MILKRPNNIFLKKLYNKKLNYKLLNNKNLIYGYCGFKILKSGNLHFHEINALQKSLQSFVKLKGFLYYNVTFNQCFTKKSIGSRMGKGKGKVDDWFCSVTAGSIIFELDIPMNKYLSRDLNKLKNKISLPMKLVFKEKIFDNNINL